MTEELLTFHKAVYQMQAQEEELIDSHQQLTEVCLSVSPTVCLFVRSVSPTVYLSFSIYLTDCLSVCLSFCLSVCLFDSL